MAPTPLLKPLRHISAIFLVCLLLLAIMAVVNYRVDPAGLFLGDQIEEAIAAQVAAGRPVAVYGNLNERYYQKRRLGMQQRKAVDYLVLGSSRAMLIGEWITNSSTVNAAYPGATLEDLFAQVAMTRDIAAKNYIVGVDPWIFNRNNNEQSWRALRQEYLAGLSLAGLAQEDTGPAASETAKLAQLVNLDYFHESIKKLKKGKVDLRFQEAPSGITPQGAALICQDGSRIAIGTCRDSIAERISAHRNKPYKKPDLEEHKHIFGLRDFVTVDPELFRKFTALIRHLQKRGTVTLVLAPYRSDSWRTLRKVNAVADAEARVREFGTEAGLRVVGSFSPIASQCGDDEFADYFHPNELCLDRIWHAEGPSDRPPQ